MESQRAIYAISYSLIINRLLIHEQLFEKAWSNVSDLLQGNMEKHNVSFNMTDFS